MTRHMAWGWLAAGAFLLAAGDNAAAEHAIELADSRGQPLRVSGFDLAIENRTLPSARERVAVRLGARRRGGHPLLDIGVPRAAVRAAPLPLGRLRAALLADEDGLGGFHVARV